jgi:hypothetical protein
MRRMGANNVDIPQYGALFGYILLECSLKLCYIEHLTYKYGSMPLNKERIK